MIVKVLQHSEPQSSKRWAWKVWLDGPDDELDQIKEVIYQLHETFPNPIRSVTDRGSKFLLKSVGWGEFLIYITVNYRDGREEKLTHWLRLGERAPVKGDTHSDSAKKGESPTVFLSSSIADSDFTNRIKTAFEKQGITVLSQDDVVAGSEWQASLRSMMEQADIGVAVISKNMSPWVESEILEMKHQNIQVIPLIRTMDYAHIPGVVSNLKGISAADDSDPDRLARDIISAAPQLKE